MFLSKEITVINVDTLFGFELQIKKIFMLIYDFYAINVPKIFRKIFC